LKYKKNPITIGLRRLLKRIYPFALDFCLPSTTTWIQGTKAMHQARNFPPFHSNSVTYFLSGNAGKYIALAICMADIPAAQSSVAMCRKKTNKKQLGWQIL